LAEGSDKLHAQAAALLARSRRAVALTGAGISTPSGIADFRTPGTGLWSRIDPEEAASIGGFMRDPSVFYDWYVDSAVAKEAALPNPAHRALAELEERGILRAVVTQNIDGLHQKAGARRVLELHGNGHTASCIDCAEQFDTDTLIQRFQEDRQVPHCPVCGGLVKPNVVFYGEMLPFDVLQDAQHEISRCDLLLVVGSSLVVAPAAELPWLAVQNRTPLIVCNLSSTWADHYAEVVLREDVAVSLPALVQLLPSTGSRE
jgi:NAD-dependent deacetylase